MEGAAVGEGYPQCAEMAVHFRDPLSERMTATLARQGGYRSMTTRKARAEPGPIMPG